MEISIKLNSINDVKNFVGIVSQFKCDMDLLSSRYIVNAKSIMGIFSLDLSNPLTLKIEDCDYIDKIIDEIDSYIVK